MPFIKVWDKDAGEYKEVNTDKISTIKREAGGLLWMETHAEIELDNGNKIRVSESPDSLKKQMGK